MNEEKIIEKLFELNERLTRIKENMATKKDVNKILDGQDKMIQLLQLA